MGRSFKGIAALLLVIALVAGVAAGIGVFARGSGATAQATSIRGEEFEYATDGVYAYNPERVVAEGVGWDAVTLFFAVPLLLATLPSVSRGSLRGRLVATGVLGYLCYQYLMYAIFWALGPLFPVFIALYPAAFAGIVWIVTTIDVAELPERVSARFPRRGVAIYSLAMAAMLVVMWSQRIALGLSGDLAGAGLMGMPTLSVQALDLGIIVSLAALAGVLLLKRHAWGYLLGPVFAIKAVTMAGAICAMLVSAALVEGSLEVAPFAVFGTATLLAARLAWRAIGSVTADGGSMAPQVTPARAEV